jgi:hypothetical protein
VVLAGGLRIVDADISTVTLTGSSTVVAVVVTFIKTVPFATAEQIAAAITSSKPTVTLGSGRAVPVRSSAATLLIGGTAAPTAAVNAQSDDDDTLSTFEIVLVTLFCLLAVALIACGLWAFCCRGNDEDNSAIHEHHASPDDDASGVPPVSACANFSRNLSHVRRVFASIPCTTAIHSVTSSSCEVECQENSAGSCVHTLLIFHTV